MLILDATRELARIGFNLAVLKVMEEEALETATFHLLASQPDNLPSKNDIQREANSRLPKPGDVAAIRLFFAAAQRIKRLGKTPGNESKTRQPLVRFETAHLQRMRYVFPPPLPEGWSDDVDTLLQTILDHL